MNRLKRYVANPDVSWHDEDAGALLFNPDTDDTTIVNLTGRALWAFLEKPRTLEEMAAYLVQTFRGVQAEEAAQDANRFVQSLMPDFILEAGNDA